MRILDAAVWGCKRLMLSDIDYIKLTFDSNQQIVIGTNGAGKSTLMREFSPLPPNPNDYTKKGGKSIKLEHNGSMFELESDFSKAPHAHSFIMDGVNLNDGGTITIQRELVRKHFRLTQDLFDVLVGDEKFTSMPALKRRDWILKISGSDLEYAMKVYKKLKTKQRDAQAMVKHYAKRLAEEQVGLVTPENIQETENKITALNEELAILYKNRINNIPPLSDIKYKIEDLTGRIADNNNHVIATNVLVPSSLPKNLSNPTMVYSYLGRLESDLINKEQRLKELYENASSFREVVDALEQNANGDLDKLLEQIQKDKVELQFLTGTLAMDHNTNFIPTDAISYKGIYDTIYPELVDIFNELPMNTEGKFSKEAKDKNQENLDLVVRNINTMSRRVYELEHSINHIKSTDKIQCPKCEFIWQPGINPDLLPQYEQELLSLRANLIIADQKQKELELEKEELIVYITKVNRFRQIVKMNPMFSELWDQIFNLEFYIKKPKLVIPVLVRYIDTVELYVKVHHLKIGIENGTSLYEQVKKVSDKHGSVTANQLVEINKDIENTLTGIKNLKRDIVDIKHFYDKVTVIESIAETVSSDVNNLKKLMQTAYDAARNQCIDYDISIRNAEVATLTKQINDAKTAKMLIDELNEQKSKAEKELEAFNIMVDKISPVNGLIAKYIKNFIDVFVKQMNVIISQIWTYDFKIMSCGIEDNEVTCKFPLSILGGTIQTPDVSKASSSQVDIVDFAFKIVLMYYLKLSDYPIYLDELAPSLDEKHRENILHFVDEFVTGKQCSQMFMISHYVAQHSIFENAEICVLSEDNIMTLPDSYNHHVVFNHGK